MNTTYKLQLETLSPIHIGAGQEKYWQRGLDYYYKDKKVYILNQKKILLNLSPQERSNFNTKVSTGKGVEFLDLFFSKNNLIDYSDFVYESSIPPQDDIRTHIRNGMGKPYIPGSSLKGAIRSAIFNHIINQERIPIRINDEREGRERFKKPNELEKDVFGDITNNLMHFIQVSDIVVPQDYLSIQHTKTFNLFNVSGEWQGGWKHALRGDNNSKFKNNGFVFSYETIMPDVEIPTSLSVSFDTDFLKLKSKNKSTPRFINIFDDVNPIESVFEIINNYTKTYIKREIDFYNAYPDDNRSNEFFIEILNECVLNKIPDSKEGCVFRFAHGSGFHSITGDWRFENHLSTVKKPDMGKRYKSRKTIFDYDDEGILFDLFGFIKLTLLK